MPGDDRERSSDTPALGVHLADSMLRAGTAEPVSVEATADLLNRAIRKCAQEAAAAAAADAVAREKKPDVGTWLRWGFGALVILLGTWWGVANLVSERPTRAEVDKTITERKPSPELVQKDREHDTALMQQQRQLDRIGVTVENIDKSVTEIKEQLRTPRLRNP